MDISNYPYNQLPTRDSDLAFISKEAWTGTRQNLEHVQIFRSRVSTFIPSEKRTKLDTRKTRKGILIGYTETSKHLRVWTFHKYHVLITTKSIVNKSKKGADLLIEHLLLPLKKSPRQETSELKPRG